MTLLERLKTETREAHDRIENAIDLDRRIASRAFFQSRCKARLLARDLEALGLKSEDIIRLPQCQPLMPLPAPEAVLGSMYVVEGSTLGGAVIARQVEKRLGFTAETGCAYFRSYGRNVAVMWKSLGAKLLEASSPEADDVIVESAQKTFTVMHDWLCETP